VKNFKGTEIIVIVLKFAVDPREGKEIAVSGGKLSLE